nr:MAG TPA: hypothetical protein [Caudoviricetes sp.]
MRCLLKKVFLLSYLKCLVLILNLYHPHNLKKVLEILKYIQ